MKKFFLCFSIALIFSCGKEDSCTQEEFLGTYTGTRTCDIIGASEDYTIILKAGSADNKVIWTIDGNDYELTIKECTASAGDQVFGIGNKFSLTLKGDVLTGYSEIGLSTNRCNVNVSK